MPNSDPRDRFFYPTLTLIIDSYNPAITIQQAQDREREEDEEEFIYPYNLGCWENLKQVFTWSGQPKSDGYTWDVLEGCDQFSFTVST